MGNWKDRDMNRQASHSPLPSAQGYTHVVALNFYPPSDRVNGFFWDSTSDGFRIMANALIFASQNKQVG